MTIAEIEKYISPRVREEENGCWEWSSTIIPIDRPNHGGYPVVSLGVGRTGLRVHRLVWAAFNGPIPNGYHVDHICTNRRCLRIDHLEAVTPEENTRRKVVNYAKKKLS